jgi:hypothetical protein
VEALLASIGNGGNFNTTGRAIFFLHNFLQLLPLIKSGFERLSRDLTECLLGSWELTGSRDERE